MTPQRPIIEKQLDLVAIGHGADGELGADRPVPLDEGRRGPPRELGFLPGGHGELQHRVVAPVGGATVELGFPAAGEIEEPGIRATAGKLMRLPKVIDPRPDELADDVVVVAHAEPVVDLIAGLGAEAEAVREAFALGRIGALGVQTVDVIVAGEVKSVHEAVAR